MLEGASQKQINYLKKKNIFLKEKIRKSRL